MKLIFEIYYVLIIIFALYLIISPDKSAKLEYFQIENDELDNMYNIHNENNYNNQKDEKQKKPSLQQQIAEGTNNIPEGVMPKKAIHDNIHHVNDTEMYEFKDLENKDDLENSKDLESKDDLENSKENEISYELNNDNNLILNTIDDIQEFTGIDRKTKKKYFS